MALKLGYLSCGCRRWGIEGHIFKTTLYEGALSWGLSGFEDDDRTSCV